MNDEEFLALDFAPKQEAVATGVLQPEASPVVETPVAPPAAPDGPVEQEDPVEPMTQWEGLKHTLEHDTLMGMGVQALQYPEFKPDPNLHVTYKDMEQRYPDINPEFYGHITEGDSYAEMDYRAEELRKRVADQERFNALHPMEQLGLGMGAAVADIPSMMATLAVSTVAGAVTGGASTAAGYSAVANRLGITGRRIAKIGGAMLGAGTQAAIQESILASSDPIRNEETVALAMATGMVFGGIAGGVGETLATSRMRKAANADAQRLRDGMIRSAIKEQQGPMRPPKYADLTSTTANQPLMANTNVQEAVPNGKLRNIAIDMTSSLKNSDDAGFRELGTILGEDAVYGGGRTMAIEKDTVSRPVHMKFLKNFDAGYNGWASKNGIGLTGRQFMKGRLQYNEAVAAEVRGITKTTDPAVKAGAKATQGFFSKMLEVAARSGVKGFDDIPENHNYLSRIYSDQSFSRALQAHGKDTIVRTIKGAVMADLKNELPDPIAEKVAEGIYKRTMAFDGFDNRFTTVVTNDIKEELAGYLDDAGLSKADIELTIQRLTEKSEDGGKPSFAMRRINMDESYVDVESGLKFSDLLENNVEQITNVYARRIGGAAAAARFGFDSPQKLIDKINAVAKDAVESGRLTKGQAETYHKKAMTMANEVLGMPVERGNTNIRKAAQLAMDYEYIRTSGGFAFASLPEMSIALAENGLEATLKSIPMTRKFVQDIKNGIPPNQEITEVLESIGVGGDIYLMKAFSRVDADDLLGDTGIPQLLQGAKRVAGNLSGLPQLTKYSQMLAGKSVVNKFSKMAASGDDIKITQWMKQLGFNNKTQMDNMLNGLKTYSKTQKSLFGKHQVVALDLAAWRDADPAAAEAFTTAVARKVNHQIQRNLTGELPEFMSHWYGKLLMQFRTFSLAAHGKKTLNALARRDVESATALVLSSSIGTMIYAGRMYALAQTRDNPDKFLEEKLSTENIAKAMVSRSGYFSLLPTTADAITTSVGQDPVFGGDMRTSGLNFGGVQSIPALQTAVKVPMGIGKGVEAAVTDEELEENDVRYLMDSLPFRRLPVVNGLLETFINQFPEKGKEK